MKAAIQRWCVTGATACALLGSLATSPAQEVRDHGEARGLVNVLFQKVRGENSELVEKAAERVIARGLETVPYLLDGLEERSKPEILWAVTCLRLLGAAEASATLVRLCEHPAGPVRAQALRASCDLVDSEVRSPLLLKGAQDPEAEVRREAFNGLLETLAQDPRALPLAIKGILDTDFWVVSRAFGILAAQPVPRAGRRDPVFDGAFSIAPYLNREKASRLFGLLARRRTGDLARLFLRALEAEQAGLRATVYEYAAREAVREVAGHARHDLLSHHAATVRAAASTYAGRIKDREALEALVAVLEQDADAAVREAAAVALRRITGQVFGYDVAKWREYLDASRKRGG